MKDKYNCLGGDLKTLLQFVFIYEKRIKDMSKNVDFFTVFISASRLFKKSIQKTMRYASVESLNNAFEIKGGATLAFTEYKVQVIDFCRHLRNSISHALIRKEREKIYIIDKQRKRFTSRGYLDYSLVIDFVVAIIKDYQ